MVYPKKKLQKSNKKDEHWKIDAMHKIVDQSGNTWAWPVKKLLYLTVSKNGIIEKTGQTSKENFSSVATSAWCDADTLTNCNKVEHDKIWKYFGKLTQERKFFENLLTSMGVTC